LALEKCEQLGPFHLEGDALTHTKMVVENLPEQSSSGLIWAGILHDVAKPLTISRKERNNEIVTQFIEHERVGADIAYEILSRFSLSEPEKEKVRWLIKNHMRIGSLPLMREFKAREFVGQEYFPELLELFKADIAASQSRTKELEKRKTDLLQDIEKIYWRFSGRM
jgi:CRISPR/Cas system-associated endonuclease Cas3-HD